MLDNPSAGKFDPPPDPGRFDPPRPARRGRWILILPAIGLVVLSEYLQWHHPRGLWAMAGAGLLVIVTALEYAVQRHVEAGEQAPYSEEQHVTR